FKGELHPEQLRALESLVSHSDGILSARTGFGKTVVAAQLIAKLNISTLILVHDKEIAKQWITQLNKFLIIADEPFVHELTPTGRVKRKAAIGSYFGTKHNRSGIVDVATIQSFKNDKASTEILDQYGLVISDEVHHDAAFTFEQVIKAIKSKYLFGLSATPFRRDGQDPIILMRFGPVRYQTSMVDEKTVTDIKRIIIPRFTTLGITNLAATNYTINENYESMLKDGERNQSIVQDIKSCFDMNRHILVLTKRIAHVEILAGLLGNSNHLFLLYGTRLTRKILIQSRQLTNPLILIFYWQRTNTPVRDWIFHQLIHWFWQCHIRGKEIVFSTSDEPNVIWHKNQKSAFMIMLTCSSQCWHGCTEKG
ncbi:MAG: DEAD/DEAH box helicase family protein, partial [Lentilactobacillus parabuchneri]|nr:DEAD/DEAH box helicase family protein [Lentilactobacillus parabuchneri]